MSFADRVVICSATTGDQVDRLLARDVTDCIRDAIATRGIAHIAVSGGSLATRALPAIVEAANRAGVDWSATHLWFADERFVRSQSSDRSVNAVREAMRAASGFSDDNLHAIASSDEVADAATAAAAYDSQLREKVALDDNGVPVLDCVLLGMGPDGHTASLFPGLLPSTTKLTAPITNSPKPPAERVTLTFTQLNASRHCWIYATGASKRDAIAAALGNAPISEYPVTGVQARETVRLYADEAALPQTD